MRIGVLAVVIGACVAPTAARVAPAPPPPIAKLAPIEEPHDAGVAEALPALADALAGPTFETIGDDVIALPIGARERRPIVVGVHGSHDRPEAACARWRKTVAAYAFIVCPKGVPYRGGLAWGSPVAIAERIDTALAALRQRYGTWIAEGPVVYAGWSLGGTRGPQVVALRPGAFEPVILAEVGHTRLDVNASVASLRKGRSTHVIVACATRRCATFDQRLERAVRQKSEPLEIAMVDAGIGRGHVFDERMARTIGASLARAVAGDPRWSGLPAALESAATDAGAEPLPDDEEDADP